MLPFSIYTPTLPRCSHYDQRTRCTALATHLLYTPEQEPCPGGYTCRQHGQTVINEYKEKLDETWVLVPYTANEWENELLSVDDHNRMKRQAEISAEYQLGKARRELKLAEKRLINRAGLKGRLLKERFKKGRRSRLF